MDFRNCIKITSWNDISCKYISIFHHSFRCKGLKLHQFLLNSYTRKFQPNPGTADIFLNLRCYSTYDFHIKIKIWWIDNLLWINYLTSITSNFCTCHDSTAVMMCNNLKWSVWNLLKGKMDLWPNYHFCMKNHWWHGFLASSHVWEVVVDNEGIV